MKKTFSDEQTVGILRGFEASGSTIKEYCRQKQVSEGTFYKWRNRFGTMEVSDVREPWNRVEGERSRSATGFSEGGERFRRVPRLARR
jgi:putative transposase